MVDGKVVRWETLSARRTVGRVVDVKVVTRESVTVVTRAGKMASVMVASWGHSTMGATWVDNLVGMKVDHWVVRWVV